MGKKSGITSLGKVPKTKCCESRSKCDRCPLRMLKEGTLPVEYAVRKRRLVHADTKTPVSKDELPKKVKKSTKPAKPSKRKDAARVDRKGRRLPSAA
ncbi:hypothetical protein GCM10009737_35720 [Nocardioides lentus]|uniref:Uncharacterized protein n=1 Tax=Nocardioides lentus TaxID=338077 RepID=A0ABN2PT74_9ACTN